MTYCRRKSPIFSMLLSSGIVLMAFSMMAFQDIPNREASSVEAVSVQSEEVVTDVDPIDGIMKRGDSILSNRVRGLGRMQGGRSMRGPMRPEHVLEVIEVASDIDPTWGKSLKTLNEEDPEEASRKIMQHGMRLRGLVLIRKRNPPLYDMKVREFKCARELRIGARAYNLAMSEGRVEEAGSLETELRSLVKKSMDLELQSRAMELAALDRALKELKSRLQLEISTQQERLEERLKEVIAANKPVSSERITQSR